jgi:hypothetical protein
MSAAMVSLGFAVGGTSLICYALMTRLQNRGVRRVTGGPAGDGFGVDAGHEAGVDGSHFHAIGGSFRAR